MELFSIVRSLLMMFKTLLIRRQNFLNSEDVLKKMLILKFKKGYVLKYLNYRICQSLLGSSIDHIDHILELVREWSPTYFIQIFGQNPRMESNACVQFP